MPLREDRRELVKSHGMRADRFTIRDVPKRQAGQRDPWADMQRHARSLTGPLQRLARLRA